MFVDLVGLRKVVDNQGLGVLSGSLWSETPTTSWLVFVIIARLPGTRNSEALL